MTLASRFPVRVARSLAFGLTSALFVLSAPCASFAQKTPSEKEAAKVAAARFGYPFKAGDTTHYRVTGFFDGRFPPFALPDGDPVHVYIALNYAAHVNKIEAQGAEVAFHVEDASLIILQEAAGPDGKLPSEDKQTDFPIPLGQIQSALDVKAILRPDGSVVSVTGGDSNSQKINLGIELRKLFLLMFPVTFPENAVQSGDKWTFNDGLLGTNQGKTIYNGTVLALQSSKHDLDLRCREEAETQVDERKDKAGKVTTVLAEAVDTSEGKASLKGEFSYTASAQPDAKTGRNTARLKEGRFTLSAVVTRKRTIPDPDNPDAPLESHIDVTARLTVQLRDGKSKNAKSAEASNTK